MSNEQENENVESGLIIFDIDSKVELTPEAAIAKIEPYLQLTVSGVDDKEGFKRVHTARMEVKSLRVSVDKAKKKLNEGALAYQRKVNAEAKRVTALILPIETHLIAQENIIEREKDRLAAIEQEKKEAATQAKLEQLAAFGVIQTAKAIEAYSDDEFDWYLKDSEKKFIAKREAEAEEARQRAWEAENNRLEAERLKAEREAQEAEINRLRAAQELELAKIRVEREELEAQQKAERDRQSAEREAVEAERSKIEAEKQRLEREEFERQAQIKAEAEAQARVEREAKERAEAEERRKADEALRLENERLKAEEAARQAELMKTDVQRIGDLAKSIEDIKRPVVASDEAKELVGEVFCLLDEAIGCCAGARQAEKPKQRRKKVEAE